MWLRAGLGVAVVGMRWMEFLMSGHECPGKADYETRMLRAQGMH